MNTNFEDLQRLNRLRMINDILYSAYDIVSSVKLQLEEDILTDELIEFGDKEMAQIIDRVKYDMETLRRYL